MNFYALNVAPIAGWETHLGSGTANQTMAATGDGRLEMHNGAGQAAMALSSQGEAVMAKTGKGVAGMSLSAAGIGYAIIHGIGRADNILSATGDGTIIPFMGGHARMVMAAQGNGRIAHLGVGHAAMMLAMTDAGRLAVKGAGLADMVLTGRYGIPNPMPNRTDWTPARQSMFMYVPHEDRTLRLLPQGRELRQPKDSLIRVKRETA